MKVGIIGLGLIGGSFAKAYKKDNHTVYAYDLNETVTDYAVSSGVVDVKLNKKNVKECELVIVSIYPKAAVKFLEDYSPHFSKKSVVIDICGTKRYICREGFRLAKEYGYTFMGTHPMAGTHNSGFKYSKENMFSGAPMVLVPETDTNPDLYEKVTEMLSPCRFGRYSVTTADKHDEMIAFTSQMAHVVSNAFIKSPTACIHKGFSAGSYKDLTRVAWLNPSMWTELFLENKDNLINEIDILISSLEKYKTALENDDEKTLYALLDEGKKRKEMVDGR